MMSCLAYEVCGNCKNSNRPFGDDEASKEFDFKNFACKKFHHLVLASGWCDYFELSPASAAASPIGASRTVDTAPSTGKSCGGSHQFRKF